MSYLRLYWHLVEESSLWQKTIAESAAIRVGLMVHWDGSEAFDHLVRVADTMSHVATLDGLRSARLAVC